MAVARAVRALAAADDLPSTTDYEARRNPIGRAWVRRVGGRNLWLARLQTDADRQRVIEGIADASRAGESADELSATLKKLAPRWFVVRDCLRRCRRRTAGCRRSRCGCHAVIRDGDCPA